MPEFLGRLRTPRLTTAPSSPVKGEMYMDTTTNVLYWWDGTKWVGAAGGADLVYNGSFPANTPYTDGDIVVGSDGVTYMCVQPTSEDPTAVTWPRGIQIPPLEEGKWLTVEGGAASWEPLPPSGAELAYEGDYAAAAYTDGDIVVYDNKAWLCVTPTNTPPDPWPGGASPSNLVYKAGYGTTLPALPADGQEHILVDSVTAPAYQWRFRYNAQSTSAYKWEFVGGAAWEVFVAAGWGTAFGTANWTFHSPVMSMTVPRPGDYSVLHGAQIGGLQGGYCQFSAGINGVATPAGGFPQDALTVPTNAMGNFSVAGRVVGVTTAIAALYQAPDTACYVGNRWMRVQPVRVS